MTEFEEGGPFAEPDPLSNESGTAYGDLGRDAGLEAIDLLEYLSEPLLSSRDEAEGWNRSDAESLYALTEFELYIPHIRATREVLTDEMNAFTTRLAAFRAALPLAEAERNWLNQTFEAGIAPHYGRLIELIGARDDEVISQGRRVRIDGNDLMRRWLAWRRQTEEYTDQGTLDLAREALREIVQLLVPDHPLPESYRALRGLDQSEADA
jgi:hypothetical protein